MNAARVLSLAYRTAGASRLRCRRALSTGMALRRSAPAAASSSTDEPIVFPTAEGAPKTYSAKLEQIAAQIAQLNLVEVAELSELLKKKLNLPDRPAMPMGGFVMPGQIAPAPDADEEAAAPKQVQTQFTVKLTAIDDAQKIAIIKEIKNSLEGYNLVQAKKFVESLPAVIKADTTKEEADKLKEVFTKVGGTVEIV